MIINFSVPEVMHIRLNEHYLNFRMDYGGERGMIFEPRTITSTYNISSTGKNKSISASLSEPMPTGMDLYLRADPPDGATSEGFRRLQQGTNTRLVKGIMPVHQNHLLLYFRMEANQFAEKQSNRQVIVTLIISD
jgi:hypothetical protein